MSMSDGGAGPAVFRGVRREGTGLDEVLEDSHEEEERDEDGGGREPEGDGVHGRAEVLERGRLAPRVRGRGHRGGWL